MANQDEYNRSQLDNPDGASYANDKGGTSFDNDNPRFIQERIAQPAETVRTQENFSHKSESSLPKQKTAKAAHTGNLVISTAGGTGVLAVAASTVAAAVVTAVYVVTAFVVNVALLLATCTSLTFTIEVPQDSERHLLAVLTGEDYQTEQEVLDGYLIFEDLEPDRLYKLTIVDQESGEIYHELTYCTQPEKKASVHFLECYLKQGTLYCYMETWDLQENDIWSVIVTDQAGKTLYTQMEITDYVETAIYVEEAYVRAYLNGKLAAVQHVVAEPIEQYDFGAITWQWEGETATATVPSTIGADPWVMNAQVAQETTTQATCQQEGQALLVATVYDTWNNAYRDQKQLTLPVIDHALTQWLEDKSPTCTEEGFLAHYTCEMCGNWFDEQGEPVDTAEYTLAPLQHDYEFAIFEWVQQGDGEVSATAKCVCKHDSTHTIEYAAQVELLEQSTPTCEETGVALYRATYQSEAEEKEFILSTVPHSLGELYPQEDPTCTEEGFAAHYLCEYCENYFDEDGNMRTAEELILPVIDHNWDAPQFPEAIEVDYETGSPLDLGYAECTCSVCGEPNQYPIEVVEMSVSQTGVVYTLSANGTQYDLVLFEGNQFHDGRVYYTYNQNGTDPYMTVSGVLDLSAAGDDPYVSDGVSYIVLPTFLGIPVTTIAEGAFASCKMLTSIELPDSITSIGAGAFEGDSYLMSMVLPYLGLTNASQASNETTFGILFGTQAYEDMTPIMQGVEDEQGMPTYYVPAALTNLTILGGSIHTGSLVAFEQEWSIECLTLGENVDYIDTSALWYTDFGAIHIEGEGTWIVCDSEGNPTEVTHTTQELEMLDNGALDYLVQDMEMSAIWVRSK